MAITIAVNLTPSTIAAVDFDLVQKPAQGGEKEAYLTQNPTRFLGIAKMTGTSTFTYEALTSQLYKTLTGTFDSSTTTLTGTGSAIAAEVAVGDILKVGASQYVQVTALPEGGTTITVDTAPNPALSGATVICYPAWPIVAVVLNELKADADPVVTFVGLTGTFTAVTYSANRSSNFSAGRAVEMTGTQTGPILLTSSPTSITNAKRGNRIGFIQLPKLATFSHVGCTTTKDISVPVKQSKAISRGLDTTFYVKTGKTTEGKLKINTRDMGADDGLSRFMGTKCVALIENYTEEQVIRERHFCTNYVPDANQTNPDADGESGLECNGNFQHFVTLPAPGA